MDKNLTCISIPVNNHSKNYFMAKNAKEVISEIRKLIFGDEAKVEETKPAEVKVEESKEEPKVEEPKAEEPKVEEPKVEEPKAEEVKAADQVDLAAMKAEIETLRAQVQTMSEYVYLKQAYEDLKSQLDSMQAGFKMLLPLVEEIGATATADPIETPKESFRDQSKKTNERAKNFATAIAEIRKAAQEKK